ncbi:hypothetical protein [Sphingomonas aerolata]|uniref:hypothetical protein n=1 Tax=Sphingomonas aerolata TaxID=185951 RepID=UPI00208EBF3D|nr:hypothetical protein [Sphingomonas aerolata]USR02365.1 hypothetical protein NEF64_18815 [Sphingomonas aerolata]
MTVTYLKRAASPTPRAASYRPGTVVIFRKDAEDGAPRRNTGYRVGSGDAEGGTVQLLDPEDQPLTGPPVAAAPPMPMPSPRSTKGLAPATRCSSPATTTRPGGSTGHGEVVAIDPDKGILVVRSKSGKRQALDMANVADRHIRPG